MEKTAKNTNRKNYGILAIAVLEFIGRNIGTAVLGFFRALIGALVLGYPVKWFWNSFEEYGVYKLDFWTAFKIVLIVGILFRRQIIQLDNVKVEENFEDAENE